MSNYTLKQWRKHGWQARWWAIRNWLHGFQFSAVRRFRCCGHTTPFHYLHCENARRGLARGARRLARELKKNETTKRW